MVNEADRIKRILGDLALPSGRWVLSGSGVLILHGIERKPRDLDIFCATQTWFSLFKQRQVRDLPDRGRGAPMMSESHAAWEVFTTDPDDTKRRCDPPYLYRVMEGLEVNVFSDWRKRGIGEINVAFWIHNAEMVDGFPCVPLQFLLDWKVEVGRSKDVDDIRLIREYLVAAGRT